MRVAPVINLNDPERRKLERIIKSRSASERLIERSRIVLLASQGLNNLQIAEQIGIDMMKVGRWRTRFANAGFLGIEKCIPTWSIPKDQAGDRSPGPREDDARETGGCFALEFFSDGKSCRHQRFERSANLAAARNSAASASHVQSQQRSEVR